MKKSALVSLSILFLLSTASVVPAQTASRPSMPAPRPVGTSGSTATTPSTTPVTPDYRLVPGDKLRIEVYKDASLSQALQVRPDGKITLPQIGDVVAEGRTSNELRDSLVSSLTEYNKNPVVTVIVVETVPPMFYVMGEVNSPGPQALKGQVSVLQALAMAGGFKDFAKTKDIRIQRKGPAGETTVKFNYKDALKGTGKMIYVMPGDTIIVP